MRGQFLLFVSILHALNLVWVTSSRPFVPNGGHASQTGTEQTPLSLQTTISSDQFSTFGVVGVGGKQEESVDQYKEVSRIGSSPPSCMHKCFGCKPCEAIQVPTTKVGVQYANYEPEGWKCKCGPTFYTP